MITADPQHANLTNRLRLTLYVSTTHSLWKTDRLTPKTLFWCIDQRHLLSQSDPNLCSTDALMWLQGALPQCMRRDNALTPLRSSDNFGRRKTCSATRRLTPALDFTSRPACGYDHIASSYETAANPLVKKVLPVAHPPFGRDNQHEAMPRIDQNNHHHHAKRSHCWIGDSFGH